MNTILLRVQISAYLVIVSFAAFLLTSPLSLSASAKDSSASEQSETYTLDGVEYTKSQIIEDFLNVAFSDLPWNADVPEKVRKIIIDSWNDRNRKKMEVYPNRAPWFVKHLYNNSDFRMLERNVLTRWSGKTITIGIDWPRYTNAFEGNKLEAAKFKQSLRSVYTDQEEDKYYGLFLKQIKSQVNAFEKGTGIKLVLMNPDSPDDKTESYGRIRIVPTFRFGVRGSVGTGTYAYHPTESESLLMNGVLFHSYTPELFDGYLLPNSDYSIDLAVCKLNPALDERILIPMINECLVRSLGLPGMSAFSSSVLSNWHIPKELSFYDRRFHHYAYEIGNEIIKSPSLTKSEKFYNDKNMSDALEKIESNTLKVKVDSDLLNNFQNFSEYERVMIALLYCPEIKSGMHRLEVEAKLLSGQCMNIPKEGK
jgi:hypothetical protein